jgi:hypothetical protein
MEDDSDYQIRDFSLASPLERLIAKLESCLPTLTDGSAPSQAHEFEGMGFTLDHVHVTDPALLDSEAWFDPGLPLFTRLFGFHEYIHIATDESSDKSTQTCNSLRSALNCACTSTNVTCPIVASVGASYALAFDRLTWTNGVFSVIPRVFDASSLSTYETVYSRTEYDIGFANGPPAWVDILEEYMDPMSVAGTVQDPVDFVTVGVESKNGAPYRYDARVVLRNLGESSLVDDMDRMIAYLKVSEGGDEPLHTPEAIGQMGQGPLYAGIMDEVFDLSADDSRPLSARIVQQCLNCDGLRDIRAFWRELCSRLRRHWECSIAIPQGPSVSPEQQSSDDMVSGSGLEQRIQMLRYCIEQSQNGAVPSVSSGAVPMDTCDGEGWESELMDPAAETQMDESVTRGSTLDNDDDDDDDDEFFDAEENAQSPAPVRPKQDVAEKDTFERKGAKCPLLRKDQPLHSFARPEMPLFVPETQPQPPKFVMLEVHASTDLSGVRVLKSDMAAFKAANPGCDMRDFLLWYSPKDVNDDGTYSERFERTNGKGDSLWQDTWSHTNAQAACDQPPLLNIVREAELVLNDLETMSTREVLLLMIPVAAGLCYQHIMKTKVATSTHVQKPLQRMVRRSLNRIKTADGSLPVENSGFMSDLEDAEYYSAVVASLLARFKKVATLQDIDRILDYTLAHDSHVSSRVSVTPAFASMYVSSQRKADRQESIGVSVSGRRMYLNNDVLALVTRDSD